MIGLPAVIERRSAATPVLLHRALDVDAVKLHVAPTIPSVAFPAGRCAVRRTSDGADTRLLFHFTGIVIATTAAGGAGFINHGAVRHDHVWSSYRTAPWDSGSPRLP